LGFLRYFQALKHLKVLAFTHQQIDLKELGKLVICNQTLTSRLNRVREKYDIPEIFYIGTCNRVEFVFSASQELTFDFVKDFIQTLNFCIPGDRIDDFVSKVSTYEDEQAFNHLLRVSCSLESLVVGEKEILAQVRKSYETCRKLGFTGDYMRMVMSHVVKTAKEVYTQTKISKNPISVVSLAYRKLRDLNMCSNSRILIIGAGETNKNICKYLQKHKYSDFAIFNRTLENAELLAADLNGRAYSLDELSTYKKGFDVIVTCTSAVNPILTKSIYESLLNGDTDKKVIVDLAIPNDTCPEVLASYPVHFIEVRSLQEVANLNMQERYHELVHAEQIIEVSINEFRPLLKQRQIELAMREVPNKIKEIRSVAMNSVFADDIGQLDTNSREILEKVMNYMEKKYISVPMVMAKEILVNNS
jgi:glutamyl-tRNA reductase